MQMGSNPAGGRHSRGAAGRDGAGRGGAAGRGDARRGAPFFFFSADESPPTRGVRATSPRSPTAR